MKPLSYYLRQCAMFALLSAGLICAALVFGEDNREWAEWIEIRLCLVAISTACLYSLSRLMKRWAREGKIDVDEPE